MATGGRLSESVAMASDEIFDHPCDFCGKNDKTAEAIVYCVDCSMSMCSSCRPSHSQLYKNHNVLNKSQLTQWGMQNVSSTDMCAHHLGKPLDMFCQSHDEFVCSVCVSTQHRSCKNVQQASDAAKNLHESKEYMSIMETLSRIKTQMNQLKQERESNKKKLRKSYSDRKASIETLRAKLDQLLHILENNTTQILDSMFSHLEQEIDKELNTCQYFLNEVTKLSDKIKTNAKSDALSAFRDVKRAKRTSKDADTFLHDINPDFSLTFNPDQEIEKLLTSLESLGEVASNSESAGRNQTSATLQPTSSSSVVATPGPDHVYRADDIKKFNVKTKNDTCVPRLVGLCVLSDGDIAAIDHKNGKLKLLDETISVIDEFSFSSSLQDICHITGSEVAVVVDDYDNRYELRFINAIRGNITCKKTIKLDHGCITIAHHNGQLYIGGVDGLYVYSVKGTNKRNIYEGLVYGVAVSDDGKKLYVTDWTGSSLKVLNSDGKVLTTLQDEELRVTSGVAIASNGSVFVAGSYSHTVLQVDTAGRKMGKIVGESDGVCYPRSLCVNKRTNELIVGQGDEHSLLVIKLK